MAASDTVVVVNPESGGGDAAEEAIRRARDQGFDVRETDGPGDGARHARAAAEEGVERVVAAGGDGTVNEVVQGLADGDALERVTCGVIPAGTGNNFASNLGIESVAEGFEVLESGPVRRLDLGVEGGRVFVNSCVGGLTAEASERTTQEMKDRWGVFAYLVATMRTLPTFESLPLTVETSDAGSDEEVWRGAAAFVMAGNARGFGLRRVTQADVEDGLLEVTIVAGAPGADDPESTTDGSLPGPESGSDLPDLDAVTELLHPDAEYVHRRRTERLDVTVEGDPVGFSFDGEMERRTDLSLGVDPGAIALHVGDGYEPDPDDPRGT